jgi:hypothetical protein
MIAVVMQANIFVITDVQKRTPNEMLGKVMAILIAVSQIAAPVGQILYGGLFEAANTVAYIPWVIASGLTFVIAVMSKSILRERESEKAS